MDTSELAQLVNFLETGPELSDLALYLGTNACLSGELSKVYIGRVEDQGVISSVATFGYKSDELVFVDGLDLQASKPICFAARKNSTVIRNHNANYYTEFPDAARFTDEWKSIVCLPLSPRYVMTLALQVPTADDSPEVDYFEMLGILIRFYINLEIVRKEKDVQPLHMQEVRGKPLTARQEIILTSLKKGMTNRDIAQEVSYSESLIRQETIIIYAKLGISGKKDLANL
jgi:DNA-binding CsgD family transcriptional regulator